MLCVVRNKKKEKKEPARASIFEHTGIREPIEFFFALINNESSLIIIEQQMKMVTNSLLYFRKSINMP